MKYKVALVKDGEPLIKMVLDDGEEVWAETTEAVVNFAKKNFEEGEVCDFDYEEDDEGYFVNKILKKKGSSGRTSSGRKSSGRKRGRPRKSSSSGDEKFCECGTKIKNTKYDKCYECNQKDKEDVKTCSECGVELKNPKYDKCYNCNQKVKKNNASGKPDYAKGAPYGDITDREAERRNKLAVLGSIAPAVATVSAGQIDPNDSDILADMILAVHEKVYKELFG